MNNKRLRIKADMLGGMGVYRIVEIDERQTFHDLSQLLLKAFELDDEHLYMFSLKRKPYEPDGIYHPLADQGISADKEPLLAAKLRTNKKMYYIYDFDDEWMFELTVMKKFDTNCEKPPRLVKGAGRLNQYPDGDDLLSRIVDWDEFKYDRKGNIVNVSPNMEDYMILEGSFWPGTQQEGTLTFKDADDGWINEQLAKLPAMAQHMWVRMVNKEFTLMYEDESYEMECLFKAGLIESDDEHHYSEIFIKKGKIEDPSQYPSLDGLGKRYEMELLLMSLIGFYGLVEEDKLYELYRENAIESICDEAAVLDTMEKLSLFEVCTRVVADGQVYISCLDESYTEKILQKRQEYPVKEYCMLSWQLQRAMAAGEWLSACPAYEETLHKLLEYPGWSLMSAERFLDVLADHVAIGDSEQEYLSWIRGYFKYIDYTFKRPLRQQFLKFRREFPSAALKGYTWEEYEKGRKDGDHQMSLFEEELPFS